MSFKEALMRTRYRARPKGWSTIHEAAVEMGVVDNVACRKLNMMFKAGTVEKMTTVVWEENGNAHRQVLYRVKK